MIVGELKTFQGEEELLRSRDNILQILDDATCLQMMEEFSAAGPRLWNEDCGVPEGTS